MKQILITTIAAVLLVGCGESQQSAPSPEANPKQPTAKVPDISIREAARTGNIEAVKQHLAAGTDVNAKSDDRIGWTPLHRSTDYGHKEIAELLIANGADVNAKATIRNDDVVTPLDWAIRAKRTEIADLIRKHGGKTSDWLNAGKSIHIATKAGHIEAVKQHLAAGTDVNTAGGRWRRVPVHEAAREGHKEIAELLIAEGADVNAEDNIGATPLFGAAGKGHKEIVELLIAEGADVNAKNKYGETPLDLAIARKQTETADLLRKHGGKTREELKAEAK
jgi:ankyrin repeat protein